MKKVLLLFAAMLLATVANAQYDFSMGPKIGYQTAKFTLDRELLKSSGNMTFGAFARVNINKFVIQPELLYYKSEKFFELNLGATNPSLTIQQRNLYLPVFFGYHLIDTELLKVRANVGPTFYFNVGKTDYILNKTTITKVQDSPIEDVSFGAALNLGVDIWRMTLDVNYSLGLTDAFDDEIKIGGYVFDLGDDTKQNIFMITLGFRLL